MAAGLPRLFDGLGDGAVRSALGSFRKLRVPAGRVIVEEGAAGASLVCVVEGGLEVRTGEVVLGTVGEGDMVGEMSLFGDGMRTASLATTSDSTLLLLDGRAYHDLRRQGHPVAHAVERYALSTLRQRLRRTLERVVAHPGDLLMPPLTVASGQGGEAATPGTLSGAVSTLARTRLFQGAPEEDLEGLAVQMRSHRFEAGEAIIEADDAGDGLLVVLDGTVDVTVDEEGWGAMTLGPADAVGLSALLDDLPTHARVVARTPVYGLGLDADRWRDLAGRPGAVGSMLRSALVRVLSDHVARANAELAMRDTWGA